MSRFENFTVIVILLISLKSSRSQTRDGQSHECLRPCAKEDSSEKLCRYEFFVSELPTTISIRNESKIEDESVIRKTRSFLGINGRSPGPQIEICLGDTIELLLYNRLGSQEFSLHWHGLQQRGTAHMDGVPMITQCSILPFGGFRYNLKPETTGTYMYYAHLVSQQADGVYGSLTVRGPQDDPSLERMLLLSSRPPTLLSRHSHLHPPTPTELLLNGQSNGTILKVDHGGQYLLRLINANAYNCPVRLSISGHEFRIVAADGNAVQSVIAKEIVSFPGTNKEGSRVAQINGMSFKYPSSPLLSQPENIQEESICSLERRSDECVDSPLFCECIQVIEVPPMSTIDIVLIDEGFGGNVSHTFHLHGYSASIIGKNNFKEAITREEIKYLDQNGQLHRNLIDPPQKDSFVVPNKGYVILRLFTDNFGYWLWEARSTAISPGMFGPGMQFLLKVGSDESFVPVPLDFPTCGNNKRPDMVFEMN
ncbi:uncharacterized protein LOC128881170 [Hylaeus volcanicus]|uniref:uncharacterized protein LOC128881170 n=1 Tax=Hylaeus volcanicus TaxID=313075 RepID=UPI0023B81E7E|nr:uncharacterized protein LOC128881170 [Hylaeus volcanicus]